MRKGEVKQHDWATLTAVGAYFDWPWWRRRLADIADIFWPSMVGSYWFIRRLRHLPWREHEDEKGTWVSPLLMFTLGVAVSSSKVKPQFWRYESLGAQGQGEEQSP